MWIIGVILTFYLLFCLLRFFIKSIPVILILPVAPFLLAKELMNERPLTAWTIIVLWALLYLVALFALVVYLCLG